MAEKEDGKIEFFVPPHLWSRKTNEGTHVSYRTSTPGMILNLGPSQYYQNPVTQEVSNQPYKFLPGFPGSNLVPVLYPQGSLVDAIVAPSAFFLGLAGGYTDKSEAEFKAELAYAKSVKEGAELATIATAIAAGTPKSKDETKEYLEIILGLTAQQMLQGSVSGGYGGRGGRGGGSGGGRGPGAPSNPNNYLGNQIPLQRGKLERARLTTDLYFAQD